MSLADITVYGAVCVCMRHPVKDDGQAAGLLVLDVLLELMAGSRAVGEFKFCSIL